ARLSKRISEYFRLRTTPSNAASTASRTCSRLHRAIPSPLVAAPMPVVAPAVGFWRRAPH
ncbi:MAG: hypothetical protein ACRDN0_05965, partial [Trebonia sp.]